MTLDVLDISGDRASVLVRGFSPADLRRRAARDASGLRRRRRLALHAGGDRPCMVSIGGRVRLYEGRFEAARSAVLAVAG